MDKHVLITPDRQALIKMQSILLSTLSTILQNKDVYFVDYPIHLNVGDLLIQLGTERALTLLNCNVLKRVSVRNEELFFKTNPHKNAVILLHGGGNFGDLYPHHQNLREKVVRAFPDNPIVVLPQSVHFESADALYATTKILKQHKNLKMFVRDRNSYDVLQKHMLSEQLAMLPDMAFVLSDYWKWTNNLPHQTLFLRRRDIEASEQHSGFDWDDLITKRDLFTYKIAVKLARAENKFLIELGCSQFWQVFSKSLINRSVAYFNQFGCVDTDRLHGMILSLLLGRPVKMRDNSYGKLSRFASAWLEDMVAHSGVDKVHAK